MVDTSELIHRAQGLDCWKTAQLVFKEYGITIPDFTIDGLKECTWESVERPCDNDVPLLVFMRLFPTMDTHVGVFIGESRIIHATSATGVIVSWVSALQNKITGYYRPCSR